MESKAVSFSFATSVENVESPCQWDFQGPPRTWDLLNPTPIFQSLKIWEACMGRGPIIGSLTLEKSPVILILGGSSLLVNG